MPDLRHEALDLLNTAGGGVLIGGPEASTQYVLAAEDVERQVAIAVIVAVEEPLFLVAGEGQIGGIEIEYGLPGWWWEGFKKQVDQEPIASGSLSIFWSRVGSAVLSSRRFRVLLPARGCWVWRLPAGRPRRGSWRYWS